MRFTLFLFLSLLISRSAAAAGHILDYTDGAITLKGYLAEAPKAKAAVVIVPEWWGLNAYAKSRADQLAKLGYTTLAADMYGDGKNTTTVDQAKEWSGAFYSDRSMMRRRVQEAVTALETKMPALKGKIVVAGYCFGGTSALEYGLNAPAVKGVAVFHAGLKIDAPKLALADGRKFIIMEGEDDPMVSADERSSFRKILKDSKADFTWIDYSGAVHAFSNPAATSFGIPGVAYSESADRQSWQHFQTFLSQVLR